MTISRTRTVDALVRTMILMGLVLCWGCMSWAADSGRQAPAEFGSDACFTDVITAATVSGQPPPVFCTKLVLEQGTSVQESNRWLDELDHQLSFASFDATAYRVFEAVDGVFRSVHWRHADHWMVDVAPDSPDALYPTAAGGSVMRPDSTFRFENESLSVDADFAAGHQDYSDLQAWGELIVTTAPEPAGYRRGGVYGYELFPGHVTLGCRLQADRHMICSLMDGSENSALDQGRIWEMSFFQQIGSTVTGGGPWGAAGEVWRICEKNAVADSACRDRFRLELTPASLKVIVNGVLYFQQTGLPRLPDELLNGDLFVYFASIVGRTEHDVVRFHWDRLAVNQPSVN